MATTDADRLRVHAVVDAGWRGRARGVLSGGDGEPAREGGAVDVEGRPVSYWLVEGDDAAAVVTGAAPGDASAALLLHARVVEALIGSRSVVPVSPPLVARDAGAVRRLLERARVPLREALDRFAGCYELRVHVGGRSQRASGGADPEEAALRLFRTLRGRARGARRLSPRSDAVLSAAFLVSRERWIDFVEEASRTGEGREALEVDVTGPWAPYDFVRFVPEGPQEDPA